MTKIELEARLEELGADVFYNYDEVECEYDVTLNDFEGFDDEWAEIDREYDNPELVDEFTDLLEDEALEKEGDYYRLYHFEGFSICLGYASMDI